VQQPGALACAPEDTASAISAQECRREAAHLDGRLEERVLWPELLPMAHAETYATMLELVSRMR
jgi:hypothetical protein